MQIPCRHIFKFFVIKELELFAPQLCAQRWTKNYYYKSHPALTHYEDILQPKPIHSVQVRVPSEIDKYKKAATITRDINNFVSTMSNSEFTYYLDKIRDIRNEMLSKPTNKLQIDEEATESQNIDTTSVAILPNDEFRTLQNDTNEKSNTMPVLSGVPTIQNNNTNSQEPSNNPIAPFTVQDNNETEQPITSSTATILQSNNCDEPPNLRDLGARQEETSQSQSQNEINPSDFRFDHIILPTRLRSVGRPKGSGVTVIGNKRKPEAKSSDVDAKKIKFFDKELSEQGKTIINWFTNIPINEVISRFSKKKIQYDDIIQDPNVFNRLKNKDIDLKCLKPYLARNTFKYISDEVARLSDFPLICAKCRKYLSGNYVSCKGCLDTYHFNCVDVPSSKRNREIFSFFCKDC